MGLRGNSRDASTWGRLPLFPKGPEVPWMASPCLIINKKIESFPGKALVTKNILSSAVFSQFSKCCSSASQTRVTSIPAFLKFIFNRRGTRPLGRHEPGSAIEAGNQSSSSFVRFCSQAQLPTLTCKASRGEDVLLYYLLDHRPCRGGGIPSPEAVWAQCL